ncbi:MAG: hypothetical protein JWM56_804 [Candidatus Peribacteria bacterium]|nr:hypothetical protein [Candidatus Peribacteria bacterium]
MKLSKSQPAPLGYGRQPTFIDIDYTWSADRSTSAEHIVDVNEILKKASLRLWATAGNLLSSILIIVGLPAEALPQKCVGWSG